MLQRRDTIDQDLERIRRANLPPDRLAALEAAEAAQRARFEKDRPEAKDIFAMVLAILSLVAPYALVFIGILLAFGLIFGR